MVKEDTIGSTAGWRNNHKIFKRNVGEFLKKNRTIKDYLRKINFFFGEIPKKISKENSTDSTAVSSRMLLTVFLRFLRLTFLTFSPPEIPLRVPRANSY